MLLATAPARRGGFVLCSRLYSSALNGNRSPLDNVTDNNTPMLHQEASSNSTEEAFELKVPGKWGHAGLDVGGNGGVALHVQPCSVLQGSCITRP